VVRSGAGRREPFETYQVGHVDDDSDNEDD
jgi:hypothetical protein